MSHTSEKEQIIRQATQRQITRLITLIPPGRLQSRLPFFVRAVQDEVVLSLAENGTPWDVIAELDGVSAGIAIEEMQKAGYRLV